MKHIDLKGASITSSDFSYADMSNAQFGPKLYSDGRSRYAIYSNDRHDHLIETESGQVIEFVNDEIEELQHKVAKELGYELTGHRLELYGKKI